MYADLELVRIASPADVARAAVQFRDVVGRIAPLRIACCHNIAVKHPMTDNAGGILASSVFGWTGDLAGWWQSDRLAFDSPIPTICRVEGEPFWVNAAGVHTRQPNALADSISLADFEQRAMTHAAIVVPVHLPFGQIGAVAFNPIDRDLSDLSGLFAAHSTYLDALARIFICSYVSAMSRPQQIAADSRLSRREVECLRWAAVGKTDEEISRIMFRSRGTVRFHLTNASVKLNAVNRSQALFKAAQLGYIGPKSLKTSILERADGRS